MRKNIFGSLACLFALAMNAAPALAQSWNGSATTPGANWSVLSTKPTTGSFPADSYEPADPALPSGVVESDWVVSDGDQLGAGFLKGSTRERKIRLQCEPTAVKIKDNILGFGVATFGHPHQGYGSITWNENSTYATLRADPRSTCAGGPMTATNYMEPAFLVRLASGGIASVKAQDQVNYYVTGTQADVQDYTYIRAGIQLVIGANASDFNDTARRARYAAAGFEYPGHAGGPAGQLGYYCDVPTDGSGGLAAATVSGNAGIIDITGAHSTRKARYLRGPSGEDAFGGTCVGNAYGPASLTSDIVAPECWWPYSLTSPNGRDHFWYEASKTDNTFQGSCPTALDGTEYVRVPGLEVKTIYSTSGFSDYGGWYLGSDRMRVATTECPDPTSPCDGVSGGNTPATVNGVYYSRVSISPCRSTGLDFCNGETIHADYSYGWKRSVFDQMQRECLGITVRGVATVDGPAECITNQVDRYNALKSGAIASGLRTWTGGCAVLGQCSDAILTKPRERYGTVPKMSSGTVHIMH